MAQKPRIENPSVGCSIVLQRMLLHRVLFFGSKNDPKPTPNLPKPTQPPKTETSGTGCWSVHSLLKLGNPH